MSTCHTIKTERFTPLDAGRQAAEAIRILNHLTLWGPGYSDPADVDVTLAEFELLAQRLPQALAQAGRWLRGAEAAGHVGHDVDDALTEPAVVHLINDLD